MPMTGKPGTWRCVTPSESHRVRAGSSMMDVMVRAIRRGEVVSATDLVVLADGTHWLRLQDGWSLFKLPQGVPFFQPVHGHNQPPRKSAENHLSQSRLSSSSQQARTSLPEEQKPRLSSSQQARTSLPKQEEQKPQPRLSSSSQQARTSVPKEQPSPETPKTAHHDVDEENDFDAQIAKLQAEARPITPLSKAVKHSVMLKKHSRGSLSQSQSQVLSQQFSEVSDTQNIPQRAFTLCDYTDTERYNKEVGVVAALLDDFCSLYLDHSAGHAANQNITAVLTESELRPLLRAILKTLESSVDLSVASPVVLATLRTVTLLCQKGILISEDIGAKILVQIFKAANRSKVVVEYLPKIIAPFLTPKKDCGGSQTSQDEETEMDLSVELLEPVTSALQEVYFAKDEKKEKKKKKKEVDLSFEKKGFVDALCAFMYAANSVLAEQCVATERHEDEHHAFDPVFYPQTMVQKMTELCSFLITSVVLENTIGVVAAGNVLPSSPQHPIHHMKPVVEELVARLQTRDAFASNVYLLVIVSHVVNVFVKPALQLEDAGERFDTEFLSKLTSPERNAVLSIGVEVLGKVSQQAKLLSAVTPPTLHDDFLKTGLRSRTYPPPHLTSHTTISELAEGFGGVADMDDYTLNDLKYFVLPALGVYPHAEEKGVKHPAPKAKKRKREDAEKALLEEYGEKEEEVKESAVSEAELMQQELDTSVIDDKALDALKQKYVAKVKKALNDSKFSSTFSFIGAGAESVEDTTLLSHTKAELVQIATSLNLKSFKSLAKDALAERIFTSIKSNNKKTNKTSEAKQPTDTPGGVPITLQLYAQVDDAVLTLLDSELGAQRKLFIATTWAAHFRDTCGGVLQAAIGVVENKGGNALTQQIAREESVLPVKDAYHQHRIASYIAEVQNLDVSLPSTTTPKTECDAIATFLSLNGKTPTGFKAKSAALDFSDEEEEEVVEEQTTRAIAYADRKKRVGVLGAYTVVARHLLLLFGSQKPWLNAAVRKKVTAEIEGLVALDVALLADVWAVLRQLFFGGSHSNTYVFTPPNTLHDAYYEMLALVARKANFFDTIQSCSSQQIPQVGKVDFILEKILLIALSTLSLGSAEGETVTLSAVVSKKVKELIKFLTKNESLDATAAKRQVLSHTVRVLKRKVGAKTAVVHRGKVAPMTLASSISAKGATLLSYNMEAIIRTFDVNLLKKERSDATTDLLELVQMCLDVNTTTSSGLGFFLYFLKQSLQDDTTTTNTFEHDLTGKEEDRVLTNLAPFLFMMGGKGGRGQFVSNVLKVLLTEFTERRQKDENMCLTPKAVEYAHLLQIPDSTLLEAVDDDDGLSLLNTHFILFCVRLCVSLLCNTAMYEAAEKTKKASKERCERNAGSPEFNHSFLQCKDVLGVREVLSSGALKEVLRGISTLQSKKHILEEDVLFFIHGTHILLQLIPFQFTELFENPDLNVPHVYESLLLTYNRQQALRVISLSATALSMTSILQQTQVVRGREVYFAAPSPSSLGLPWEGACESYIAKNCMLTSFSILCKVFNVIRNVFVQHVLQVRGRPEHVDTFCKYVPQIQRALFVVALLISRFDWDRKPLVAFLNAEASAGLQPEVLLGGKGVMHNVFTLLLKDATTVATSIRFDTVPEHMKGKVNDLKNRLLCMVLNVLTALCGKSTAFFAASEKLIGTCLDLEKVQTLLTTAKPDAPSSSPAASHGTNTDLRSAALSLIFEFLLEEQKRILAGQSIITNSIGQEKKDDTKKRIQYPNKHLMEDDTKKDITARDDDHNSGLGVSLMRQYLSVVHVSLFSHDRELRTVAVKLLKLCYDQALSIPQMSIEYVMAVNDAANPETHHYPYTFETNIFEKFNLTKAGDKKRKTDTFAVSYDTDPHLFPAYLMWLFSAKAAGVKEYSLLIASKLTSAVQKKYVYAFLNDVRVKVGHIRGVVAKPAKSHFVGQCGVEFHLSCLHGASGGAAAINILRALTNKDTLRTALRELQAFYSIVAASDLSFAGPASLPTELLLHYPRYITELLCCYIPMKQSVQIKLHDVITQGLLLETEVLQSELAALLGEGHDSDSDGNAPKRRKTAKKTKKAKPTKKAALQQLAELPFEKRMDLVTRGCGALCLYNLALWYKTVRSEEHGFSCGGHGEALCALTIPFSHAGFQKEVLPSLDPTKFYTLDTHGDVQISPDHVYSLWTALNALSLDAKFLNFGKRVAKPPAKRGRKRQRTESSSEDSESSDDDEEEEEEEEEEPKPAKKKVGRPPKKAKRG